jgi:hypothetical protein
LTSLNLASNNLVHVDLPDGWFAYEGELLKGRFFHPFFQWPDGVDTPPEGSKLVAAGIIAIAGAIPDMRAILSVNLLKNSIGVDQATDLMIILKEHPTLKSLCGNKGNETELDMSGKTDGAGDAIMLAAEIVDNGALSKLICGGDGTYSNASTGWKKIPFEPATLEVGMTEADFSNKGLGAGGAIIVSAWITHKDNGALSTLIFGGDTYNGTPLGGGNYEQITPVPATLGVGMTEVDFSNKNLGVGGAIIISVWLTHKHNGAMTSLNLASNDFGVEGAESIAAVLSKCT